MLVCTFLASGNSHAEKIKGLSFSHNDWEIACDNTGTCRAAGYQSDSDNLSLSVLLTRKAGAEEQVSGSVMLGNYSDEEWPRNLPKKFNAMFTINSKQVGNVFFSESLSSTLSQDQVFALVNALSGNSEIEISFGEFKWRLSDRGAAAVFLKMDEFQKRLGTVGALVRKGSSDESKVLKSEPVQVINIPKQLSLTKYTKIISGQEAISLIKDLKRTTNEKDCSTLFEDEDEAETFELTERPLSNGYSLISTRCWLGAYNEGYGFWVLKKGAKRPASLVTTLANHYADGEILATSKARGLGDCWSTDGWAWNGESFIHSKSSTTGLCKLVAPGGAWDLPTIVSEIHRK